MAQKQSSAFITTKKGTCYLTVKLQQAQFSPSCVSTITRLMPNDKRDMRRLHPDVGFRLGKNHPATSGEAGRVQTLSLPAKNEEGACSA